MSAAFDSEQQDLEIKQIRKKVSKSWMILYGQVEILLIQPMYTASGWKDTETAVSRS